MQYISQWKTYLINHWGVNADLAEKVANLVLALNEARIRFTITSGYRSPAYQQLLINEYKAGNKSVYTPAPVGKSLHQHTNWMGKPDSLAVDIQTSNPPLAGSIAKKYGIVWAGRTDPVHFGARSGSL